MRRVVVWLTVFVCVLCILACMGMVFPIEIPALLVLGWIWYIARTLPEIQIATSGVATAAACLLLLAIGSHFFLTWIYQELRKPTGDPSSGNPRWKWRWTFSLLTGTMLMFVAGIATVGVTHQLGWLFASKEPLLVSDSGGAVRRAQSTNNLKQIGLALINYGQAYNCFPPGGTFDRTGHAIQSWQTLILPYMEQEALYQRIDLRAPWNDARNLSAFQTPIPQYLQPGIDLVKNEFGDALTHYAANSDMLGGDHPRTISDVSDGTANTFMVGEVVSDFKPWGDPTNWRDPRLGLNRSPQGFGSPSPGGANFLFVDGSVRFIKNSVDSDVLKALSTPAGHEKLGSEQY
jgi:prepilin-type processing-associated H-X9-DG protein